MCSDVSSYGLKMRENKSLFVDLKTALVANYFLLDCFQDAPIVGIIDTSRYRSVLWESTIIPLDKLNDCMCSAKGLCQWLVFNWPTGHQQSHRPRWSSNESQLLANVTCFMITNHKLSLILRVFASSYKKKISTFRADINPKEPDLIGPPPLEESICGSEALETFS